MAADDFKMFGLLLVWFCVSCVLAQGPAGPPSADVTFVVVFTSEIYLCLDGISEKYIDTSRVEASRVNETTSCMRGIINFKEKFNHNTMLELRLLKETQGKLEVVLTHEICDVCAEIGNVDSDYYKILQFFGLPESCPFEPGEYHIHDLMVDTTDMPVNSANAGCYVANINLYKLLGDSCKDDLELLACLKLDFCIEPL